MNTPAQRVGMLSWLLQDGRSLLDMLRAYGAGEFKEVPWRTLGAVAASLVYFFSPIDLIPDFILGVGLIDDAAVFAFVLRFLRMDIERFRQWQAQKSLPQSSSAT